MKSAHAADDHFQQWLKSTVDQAKANNSWKNRVAESWKSLPTSEKAYTGMALLGAGLSTISAFSHASKAVQTDAEGKHHWQPSMVGLALLDTVFALGSAGVAALFLRSGAAR